MTPPDEIFWAELDGTGISSSEYRAGRKGTKLAREALLMISGFIFLLLFAWTSATHAQAPFYQGKTINVVVGLSAGGSGDLFTRLLARYMGKRIPGDPSFIVQNMPGAGSLIAANYVYSVAKPDG